MLPEGHLIVEAQQTIYDIIANEIATFGIFGSGNTTANTALIQIRSLANRVLNFASIHGFDHVQPSELINGLGADAANPSQARSTLNNSPPVCAVDTAVGVGAALCILSLPDVLKAGRCARWIVDGQNAHTGPAELRSCAHDDDLSAAIAIEACRPALGPELQLRYRAALSVPCAPDLDSPVAARIAMALPAVLWREWSDRLLRDVRATIVLRRTLSCATTMVGNTIKPVEAARLFGETATANALNHRLWVLQGSAHWIPMCVALIRLNDYLEDCGAPIDYARRRRLDYSRLLPNDMWQQMLRRNGSRLRIRAVGIARSYLIAGLSGGLGSDNRCAASVTAFEKALSPALREALEVRAQNFLEELGIAEPVHWHAPLDLLSGLPLPEIDV